MKTDGTIFNFNKFKNSLDLASNIYRNKELLKDAENKQQNIKILLNKLRKYNPTNPKKIKDKEETLSAAEKLLNNKQEVIDAFKTGIFSYIDAFQIKEESKEERAKKFLEYIESETKDININFFNKYFNFAVPSALAKQFYETKYKKKNKLVNIINSGLSDLKDEIKKMSEDEKKKFEQPDKVLKILSKIIDFNKQIQEGLGLNILTPNQLLSRLSISLAQCI